MALDHFYTIKDKKKINILDAIERCMQKFDYDELSINDIVTEADISRGSFYNYFYDKSDAVETLVKEKTKIIFSVFKECIIENDGRLLDGAYEGYMRVKGMLKNKIFLTVMKNLKYFIEIGLKIIYSESYEKEFVEFVDWLLENTVEGRTKITTREQMANVVDLLISLISNMTLKIVLASGEKNENDGIDYKFNIIRKGIESL
ncbi:MAG: TetR/AcrR family transcriptional regulator [Lachnospiraceae bacterium]|nr:TetR/AcrR family transcriptional regulator [Lachnospiraceae bacterium]